MQRVCYITGFTPFCTKAIHVSICIYKWCYQVLIMKKTGLYSLFFLLFCHQAWPKTVALLYDDTDRQALYARHLLVKSLTDHGYQIVDRSTPYNFLINLDINGVFLSKESFEIIPENNIITLKGGDGTGLIYAAITLRELLDDKRNLETIQYLSESPQVEFRGIKHNLPWDEYRANPALTQHRDQAQDPQYWEAFLDMMVENRFNVLSLWNLHPFTYLIQPKNFPEARPFTESEFSRWKALYTHIFRLAKDRGIDTYLVNWSIFVSEAFANTHQVGLENIYPNFYVNGDSSEIIKRYTKESVTQVLEEYPDLSGFGISHGEGMGGMTPQERQDWINETMIEGMRLANRKAKFIHRVPFSANLSSGGSTSRSTELLTRQAMEKLDFLDGPIWVEMKFNWSHGHSTPNLIKVHGGELGDTYFVPEPQNYKITWMVRNEDFFALRWGVPDFIRSHIARNHHSYVGGYFVGSEGYIPVKDYFTAGEERVDWNYAFQRQWLFYKTWGRLLYNPSTPDSVFEAAFRKKYGKGTEVLVEAFALASSTQLRLASIYDSTWDLTLYGEGFMSLENGRMNYISVSKLMNQKTMDPQYLSIADFVTEKTSGSSGLTSSISPLQVADQLQRDALRALKLVADLEDSASNSLRYEIGDVKIWANLGLHLAEKIRGAVHLKTFQISGEESNRALAIRHLETALSYWDKVISVSRPLYKDMPLTPYLHNENALFHWEKLRPSVEADLQIAGDFIVNN
jgi:hypothetical protein